jgi:hypothetical protein
MNIPIIGLKKRFCLQCAVEYIPQGEKQVICNLCVSALSRMPEIHQAFMARMARRIFELEQRVVELEGPHRRKLIKT